MSCHACRCHAMLAAMSRSTAPKCRWHKDPDSPKPARQVFNDLWQLDCNTWTWQKLAGPGSGAELPAPRSACGMAVWQEHLLVFGGKTGGGLQDHVTFFADLWSFSLEAGTWCVQMAISQSIALRAASCVRVGSPSLYRDAARTIRMVTFATSTRQLARRAGVRSRQKARRQQDALCHLLPPLEMDAMFMAA